MWHYPFKNNRIRAPFISLQEEKQMVLQEGEGKLLASFMVSHRALHKENYQAGNEDRAEILICCCLENKRNSQFYS